MRSCIKSTFVIAAHFLSFSGCYTSRPDSDLDFEPKVKLTEAQKIRDEKDHAEASRMLDDLKSELPNKNGEELIEMLKERWHPAPDPADHVDYYRIRDGNKMIVEELTRRGDAIHPILEKHKHDQTSIFAGLGGSAFTVGQVCQRILKTLEDANR